MYFIFARSKRTWTIIGPGYRTLSDASDAADKIKASGMFNKVLVRWVELED